MSEELEEVLTEDEVLEPQTEQPEVQQEEQIELLEWADLYIRCSCGACTTLQSNIEKGAVRFYLPTSTQKTLDLQCPVCKHKLSLAFMAAFAPPVAEIEAEPTTELESDEQVQEESQTKE